MLFISFTVFSQIKEHVATSVCYKILPNGVYSDWVDCNIKVNWNLTKKHIVIYSEETQIIDYTRLEESFEDGVTIYQGYATDATYQIIFLSVIITNNYNIFLKIKYSDIEYMYRLE